MEKNTLAILAVLLAGALLLAGCAQTPMKTGNATALNGKVQENTTESIAPSSQTGQNSSEAELRFFKIMRPNETYVDSNELTIDSKEFRRHGRVQVKLDAPPTFYENSTDPIWQEAAESQRGMHLFGGDVSLEARVVVRSLDNRTLVNQTVPDGTAWRFTDAETGEEYEFGINNMDAWRGKPFDSAWFYIDQISLHCDKDENHNNYSVLMPGDSLASADGYKLVYHGMEFNAQRLKEYRKRLNLTILDAHGDAVRRSTYGLGDIGTNGRFVFCPLDYNNGSDLRIYAKSVPMEYRPAYCILNGSRDDEMVPGLSMVEYMDSLSYDGLLFRYEGNFWTNEPDPPRSAAEIRIVNAANETLGLLEVPEFSEMDWADPASGRIYEVTVCQYDHEHGWGVPGMYAMLNVSQKK
ncbi:Uncharacterised protein [uncultured archaeon]|nr:Uncharacterised protein [uncultured archaeon]